MSVRSSYGGCDIQGRSPNLPLADIWKHPWPCGSTVLMPHVITRTIPTVATKEKIVINVMWSMIVPFLSSGASAIKVCAPSNRLLCRRVVPSSCEDFWVMTKQIPQDGERPTVD